MNIQDEKGFGLIEVLVMIVVMGIVAAIALQWMTSSIDDIRRIRTEREMDMIISAIAGDPALTQNGTRYDFGYVGDVGAFPSSLLDLYRNPGGFSTWDGPYLPAGFTADSLGFRIDEWGSVYQYSGGTTITSFGSGSSIIRSAAGSTGDYLLNSYSGTIKDALGNSPGSIYADSVELIINIPDGTGFRIDKSYYPDASGSFTLDSLPVGRHSFYVIYSPQADTLKRYLTILPQQSNSITREFGFSAAYFE